VFKRPKWVTQCCIQVKSTRDTILYLLFLHCFVEFTFKCYGNYWNKTLYSLRVWIRYNWVSRLDFNVLAIFSSKNVIQGPKLTKNIFICLLDHVYQAPPANRKIECQGWPKMSLILGRSGTQYVAMEIKLLSSNSGAHLVESYCKESNISDTNWLRYLFSSYLIKTWLSIWRHQLANLHILKTWISLEQKEIFENSKQHFSSHVGYLFVFKNGFNRKDVIFVLVAL